MTQAEFAAQVSRLIGVYGERSFPKERVASLWSRYHGASSASLVKAVDWIVLQMPQPSQLISVLDDYCRSGIGASGMNQLPPAYDCEACRDHGYGFDGDLAVRCSCEAGRHLSPEVLAKAQRAYNQNKEFFERRDGKASFLPDLPYDKPERIG